VLPMVAKREKAKQEKAEEEACMVAERQDNLRKDRAHQAKASTRFFTQAK
jgi:hypothetical protein